MSDIAAAVVQMANQIAANFAAQGDEMAIRETAQHIRLFWDPRMKRAIADSDTAKLSAIALAAGLRRAALDRQIGVRKRRAPFAKSDAWREFAIGAFPCFCRTSRR